MNIIFIGTGEACDRTRANTSVLIENRYNSVLLDCGFSAASAYFLHESDHKPLDAVWISHLHGDHYFGLPQLILHLFQQKRKKNLYLLSGCPVEKRIKQAVNLAYPSLLSKLGFELSFQIVEKEKPVIIDEICWRAAENVHSIENFSVLLESEEKKIYYSGDGKSSIHSEKLMKGADLIIHEAFSLENRFQDHGSVAECIELYRRNRCRKMGLVHLCQEAREQQKSAEKMVEKYSSGIFFPEDGHKLFL